MSIFWKICKTYCTLKESLIKTDHILRSVKRIPTNNLYSFSIPICKQWSYKNRIEHFPNPNLSAECRPHTTQPYFIPNMVWIEIKYQKSSRHYRQSFISQMQSYHFTLRSFSDVILCWWFTFCDIFHFDLDKRTSLIEFRIGTFFSWR